VAGIIGIWLGRRAETSSPIASLLESASMQTTLTEVNTGRRLISKDVAPAVLHDRCQSVAFVLPQVPPSRRAYAVNWALRGGASPGR